MRVFFGKYHVKFGNIIFSYFFIPYIIFAPLPKLTQLLRLCPDSLAGCKGAANDGNEREGDEKTIAGRQID